MSYRRGSVAKSREFPARVSLGVLCLALGLAGCGREEIRIYRIPKEPARAPGLEPRASPPAVAIDWEVPEGWEAQSASGMRLANFRIAGGDGEFGDASVLSLAGGAGQELAVVNIIREQLGLPAVSPPELAALRRPVPIGSFEGAMYDMMLEPGEDRPERRLLVAVFEHGEAAWYFNLRGSPPFVSAEEPVFRRFLESVSLAAAAPEPRPAVEPGPGAAAAPRRSQPHGEAPDHWREQPPGPMLAARYLVETKAGQAEITVSSFPGDVGGVAANINRWRGQAGLGPVSDAEALSLAGELDLPSGPARITDLTGARAGQAVRLIGVIAARGDRTWFYKMLGDEPVVAGERDRFLGFLRTLVEPVAAEGE